MINPGFRYTVRIDRPTYEMIDWCNQYQCGTFDDERYYIAWTPRTDATFSFETEQPSIMFALRWL